MNPFGTKEEALAWKARWDMVNDFELQELRGKSMSAKARELEILMNTAVELEWETTTEEEVNVVRDRWIRLKQAAVET